LKATKYINIAFSWGALTPPPFKNNKQKQQTKMGVAGRPPPEDDFKAILFFKRLEPKKQNKNNKQRAPSLISLEAEASNLGVCLANLQKSAKYDNI
jgi:hypothetical protein